MVKILVAEDESIVLSSLKFRLEKEGYEVIAVENGRDALEFMQNDTPDLIITDIMMPFVTGLELITHVRSNVERRIPIVVISAVGLEDTVLEAFELGADDFITKPLSPNELLIRIKRLILMGA